MRLAAALFLVLFLPALAHADQPGSIEYFQFEYGQQAYDRQDYKTALEKWQPLASLGETRSLFMLGWMYHDGTGVKQDYAEAGKFWRTAADQGSEKAQLNLGNLYMNGQGVTQDYAEAYFWFRLALNTDKFLSAAKNSQDAVAKYLTQEQVTEIDERVKEWKASPIKFGHYTDPCIFFVEEIEAACKDSEKKYNAEKAYRYGVPVIALKDWKELAAKGDAEGQYDLGEAYHDGIGVKKDDTEAMKWYRKAAAQGYLDAKKRIEELTPAPDAAPSTPTPAPPPQTDSCTRYQSINPAFYANCESRMKPKQ